MATLVNTLFGTAGNDTIVGAGHSGVTWLAGGGDDFVQAMHGWESFLYMDYDEEGNEYAYLQPRFSQPQMIDGGEGYDTLRLRYPDEGLYGDGIELMDLSRVLNFERIEIDAGEWYSNLMDVRLEDVTLVTGQRMLVTGFGANTRLDASAVGADKHLDVQGVMTVTGGAGNDSIVGARYADGGSGNDTISGGAGKETMRGGAGDDVLDGGEGVDTAVFSGNYADYTVVQQSGYIEVSGADGVDRLYGIERMRFDDQDVDGLTPGLLVEGTELADNLDRDLGNHTIYGFAGNDILSGGQGDDFLDGGADNDYLNGGAGVDTLIGGDGNDSIFEGEYVDGGEGNDEIYGGTVVSAGAGDDLIVNAISVDAGDGNDTVGNSQSVVGGSGDDTIYGSKVVDGGDGNDTIEGGGSGVQWSAGAGDDLVVAEHGGEALIGFEYDEFGNEYTYLYDRYVQPQLIDGGEGFDTMRFVFGADTTTGDVASLMDLSRVVNFEKIELELLENWGRPLEVIIKNQTLVSGQRMLVEGVGIDTGIDASDLAADKHLDVQGVVTVTGGAGNDSIVGAIYADGGSGDDTLLGGESHDFLRGGAGNDILDGGAGENVAMFSGNAAEYDLVYGAGYLEVIGLDGIDRLTNINLLRFDDMDVEVTSAGVYQLGDSGNNSLQGTINADTLEGGLGNDTYTVDNAADVVIELPGEGTDTVRAYIDEYVLADNVERLVYTGSGQFVGTGNMANNTLFGGVLDDLLDGAEGNDTLLGGEGFDTLLGSAGNDSIVGGAGADVMEGGEGNDIYVVDDTEDSVFEGDGEGNDTVRTSLDQYQLTDNVEKLIYTGSSSFWGTGNSSNNTLLGADGGDLLSGEVGNDTLIGAGGSDSLYGGTGNDSINGGVGSDLMAGGAGNDNYVVDDIFDEVLEETGEGIDTVRTSLNQYTLGANLEKLYFDGGEGGFHGVGNELNNTLIGGDMSDQLEGGEGADALLGNGGEDFLFGGAGNDNLNGGEGADQMYGEAGNDIYLVDDENDLVIELVGEGTDTIRTTLGNFQLGDNVENLTYIGTEAFVGMGNGLNNALTGGVAADWLDGGEGNDVLRGGGGNDSMVGGYGNDRMYADTGNITFVFGEAGFGQDQIYKFDTSSVDGDLLDVSALGVQADDWGTYLQVQTVRGGVKISVGMDSITLVGVPDAADVTAASFIFA